MDGFPKYIRKIIFALGGAKCSFCGRRWRDGWMLECDHIVPRGNGGTNAVENGQLLCISCHAAKHRDMSKQLKEEGSVKGANAHAYWARKIASRNPRRYWY